MNPFNVTILGCGSALPTERHYCSSQVVNHHGNLFMVDCGEGAHYQFQRNHLHESKLNHIFISHLHADHCLGLTGVLVAYALKRRTADLHVYAPAEFEGMLYRQFEFYASNATYRLVFHPIEGSQTTTLYEDGHLSVQAFPLEHKVPCYGFLFQADGHGYAYCSDTKRIAPPTEALYGVDLLYHEATYADSEANLAATMYHATARHAAQFAREIQAKKLIIGHPSSRYRDESILLKEAHEVFPNTILAEENLCVAVGG